MNKTRQQVELILQIIIVFLLAFLLLSWLTGGVTLYSAVNGLVITYIILHYWERQYLKKKQQKKHKIIKVK